VQESSQRTAAAGGTAVIAYDLTISTLGVLHTADGMAGQVQRDMLFMPLIKLDTAQEPLPWLAERWDTVRVSPDSLELTFHLRGDVSWHDGVPTTADDVRFTFDRIMDPRTGAIPRRLFSLYNSQADVLDPRTIRFRLRASGGFLNLWSDIPPLPRHLLEEVPPERLAVFVDVFNVYNRENPRGWSSSFENDGNGSVHLEEGPVMNLPRLPSLGVSWEF
jgi:ABC-type transport system substrate-binding protein